MFRLYRMVSNESLVNVCSETVSQARIQLNIPEGVPFKKH